MDAIKTTLSNMDKIIPVMLFLLFILFIIKRENFSGHILKTFAIYKVLFYVFIGIMAIVNEKRLFDNYDILKPSPLEIILNHSLIIISFAEAITGIVSDFIGIFEKSKKQRDIKENKQKFKDIETELTILYKLLEEKGIMNVNKFKLEVYEEKRKGTGY